jgi:hypothetical protein
VAKRGNLSRTATLEAVECDADVANAGSLAMEVDGALTALENDGLLARLDNSYVNPTFTLTQSGLDRSDELTEKPAPRPQLPWHPTA